MSALPTVHADLEPGSLYDGFTIDKKIGEGGMAVLYLAKDAQAQQVVLKIPKQAMDVDPVSMVAFENELRLAPYLDDFPLAYMPRVNADPQSRYLVMDYIEGVDLWTHLRDNGCLTEDEAISLMKKIVYAVGELHKRHIVHLDLKLSNIMITTDGEVRLIDFGLANHTDLPDLIYESFHDPKGTPTYIAPEQFIGVRDEPRSDLFSLGVMLFEMTTNEIPFGEGCSELDVINRIKRKITLPSRYKKNLSQTFDFVVGMCLHPNPDIRFNDAEHFLDTLGMWEGELPIDSIMGFTNKRRNRNKKESSLLKPAYRALKNLLDHTPDNFQRVKQWAEGRRNSKEFVPQRILVAIEFDENDENKDLNISLVKEAFYLSKLCPTNITVITVVTQDVGMANGEKEMQVLNTACNVARKQISTLLEKIGENDTSAGINVRFGNVVDTINTCIEHYNADLLLIGEKKKNKFSHYVNNTTGKKILSEAKCSTYLIKEGKGLCRDLPQQEEGCATIDQLSSVGIKNNPRQSQEDISLAYKKVSSK